MLEFVTRKTNNFTKTSGQLMVTPGAQQASVVAILQQHGYNTQESLIKKNSCSVKYNKKED